MITLPRSTYRALQQLLEQGYLCIAPDARILDLGCGRDLGWVPDFFAHHPFGHYVGVDRLPVREMGFRPNEVRDRRSESLAICQPMSTSDWYRYYTENNAHPVSMDFVQFSARISRIGDTDLTSKELETRIDGRFDLVLLSDVLHLLEHKDAMDLVERLDRFLAPGSSVLVRYFDSHSIYGSVDGAVEGRLDELLGQPARFEAAGWPAHRTRFYRT